MEHTAFLVLKNMKTKISGQKAIKHLKSEEQVKSWKDSFAVKSTQCFCRDMGFCSQDAYGVSTL